MSRTPAPDDGADHWRKKLTMSFEDEPQMDTNTEGPPWVRQRHGMMSPRERGRPARTTLARPRPTPRPGSTGNGARTLLRPGPCCSHGQGGRVPHPRETERHATAQHAGGTPALPGGPAPNTLAPQARTRRLAGLQPCRCGRVVTLRVPSSSFLCLRG